MKRRSRFSHRPSLLFAATFMLAAAASLPCTPVRAEADGPDFWEVTGVATDDVLNIRAAPAATAPILGTIPPDGRRLANLGCNTPSFTQWMAMNAKQQQRAARNRWCRIDYNGTKGWVRGRYLREGG